MVTQTHDRALEGRRPPMLATAVLLGLAAVSLPSAVAAEGSNPPTVQVICQLTPGGGMARIVRVTYPVPVKNVHVFWPVGGGANVVRLPPATAIKVYSLAVPAGSYSLKYVTQRTDGGYPPFFYSYDPVIVVQPSTGCQGSKAVGTPSS
jgi:hypothetical protein